MTVLGLPERDVRGLLAAVRPASEDPDACRGAADADSAELAELFARATWTVVAEPGDEVATAVIDALGAAGALAAALEDRRPADLAVEVDALQGAGTLSAERLRAALGRWRPRLSARRAVIALEQAARFACRLVVPDDPEWPQALADLGQRAPIALWARGRQGLLGIGAAAAPESSPLEASSLEAVAIVGARAATGYGEHVAAEFAAGLVEHGAVVISGGAYGIDGAAHRGAIAAGGTTVAVLAGGLDRLYPAGHETLLRRVAEHGVLLAEVACGTPPTRVRFLQRNRLIAAIADSVVVVEAGARSGTLNTAGHAAEIGRPIGAVPGPITSASSAGCHRLLREFPAACVTSVEEVLALHRGGDSASAPSSFDRRSLAELQVLDALRPRHGRTVAEVAKLSGLGDAEVRVLLGRLELDGAVARGAAGWVRGPQRA